MTHLRHRVLPWLLVGALAAGCGEDPAGPVAAPLPPGLTLHLDQSRVERQGRTVFVRLVDEPERRVSVTRAEISSPRFGEVTWTGEKSFENEADLEVELPVGRCGSGSDAQVELTYRLDDGPVQVSTATARDRYGAVALFLDRDCAEQTFARAADLVVGTPRVTGRGRGSVFSLPVRMVPAAPDAGRGPDVAFGGFEDTVLFRVADGSPRAGAGPPVPVGGEPVTTVLRLVPSRCDPHALAEDKVGTLVGVRVVAPGLTDLASFYLPLEDAQRSALRGFFATHCGL